MRGRTGPSRSRKSARVSWGCKRGNVVDRSETPREGTLILILLLALKAATATSAAIPTPVTGSDDSVGPSRQLFVPRGDRSRPPPHRAPTSASPSRVDGQGGDGPVMPATAKAADEGRAVDRVVGWGDLPARFALLYAILNTLSLASIAYDFVVPSSRLLRRARRHDASRRLPPRPAPGRRPSSLVHVPQRLPWALDSISRLQRRGNATLPSPGGGKRRPRRTDNAPLPALDGVGADAGLARGRAPLPPCLLRGQPPPPPPPRVAPLLEGLRRRPRRTLPTLGPPLVRRRPRSGLARRFRRGLEATRRLAVPGHVGSPR